MQIAQIFSQFIPPHPSVIPFNPVYLSHIYTPITDTDLAYYVLYVKAEDTTTPPPVDATALWNLKNNTTRVARYKQVPGSSSGETIRITIVDDNAITPIATAKRYYIAVRVVNTTITGYDATNSETLFGPWRLYRYTCNKNTIHITRSSTSQSPSHHTHRIHRQ